MNSILKEISRMRKDAPFVIDYKNKNRYRIVAIESNGTKTAYYFSTPIYNNRSRKALDIKFHTKEKTIYTTGSNANITITGDIRMENAEGACILSLANQPSLISEHEVLCGNTRIYPTTNGIAIKSACQDNKPFTFAIESSRPFLEVRANNKYFALMSERFKPFFAVSCIGTTDDGSNIISPAKLIYEKITDRKYTISVLPCSSLGRSILFEANLYEPKLFQDTTVESNNPNSNNAFGGVGFIGTTKELGEQWLYSRLDFQKMPELNDKKITRVILHLPKLNSNPIELSVSNVMSRFCSFGSTWNNKVSERLPISDSQIIDRYVDIDITGKLSDKYGRLYKNEGFIIKPKRKSSGFSAIATADNYLFPQILEINYQ